jgi:flagellar biosynthesis protein FlhF
MKVMRFVGQTSRDAMRKLRDTLGPDALVLANRPCAEGIELLAAAPGELGVLPSATMVAAAPPQHRPTAVADEAPRRARPGLSAETAEPAVPPSGMSTVSFQDYVRQRLRERHQAREDGRSSGGIGELAAGARAATAQAPLARAEATPARAEPAPMRADAAPMRADSAPRRAEPAPMRTEPAPRRVEPVRAERAAVPAARMPMRTEPTFLAPPPEAGAYGAADAGFAGSGHPGGVMPGLFTPPELPELPAAPGAEAFAAAGASASAGRPAMPGGRDAPQAGPSAGNEALVAELQSLKGMIARQFATVSWFEGVRRSPVQGKLLRMMVSAGFSLKLARSVVSKLPSDYGERDAQTWLEEVLARNLRCAPRAESFEAGGVFALVGPTGVGKTTTTAKIAARHVLKHGAQSVALITVDTYRLGAHDQLRAFGRILGVPVHIAHDASALHDLLRLRGSRQLVLIDTVGMGHRDERIRSLLMSLPRADIKHVVVASCAAQAETIDESLRAYEARQAAGVVLTKVDEAARLGGALDCLLRQRVRLLGVCDGQRVPEDWQAPDGARLARRALLAPPAGAFALDDEELPLVFGVAAALQGDVSHA